MKNILLLFFYAVAMSVLNATTIAPFSSLQELRDVSSSVVFVRAMTDNLVTIHSSIKGNNRRSFQVNKYAPGPAVAIWGDINLKEGHNYLLFLDSNNKPLCLSYYVYEEIDANLFPVAEANSIYAIGDIVHGGFPRDSLLGALRGTNKWPQQIPFPPQNSRAEPLHCAFLTINSVPLRMNIMPAHAYHTPETEIGSCMNGNYSGIVSAALSSMTSFTGVTYLDAGLTTYVAECGDGTALGNDYLTFLIDNHTLSTGIIFFNDPCSEINDMSNCSGVLAFGGGYSSGQHEFDGYTWNTLVYPFVVVNNGVAACLCSDYSLILAHELTHTLGIGHIAGGHGPALMNPYCCNDITQLDQDCVNYAYPPNNCPDITKNHWQGTVSQNWSDSQNWSLGIIPTLCQEVYISAGFTVNVGAGQVAEARTLSISLTAVLDINPTATLEVTGGYSP